MSIEEIISALRTDDLENQEPALREMRALAEMFAEESVKAFSVSRFKIIFADHIFMLGHAVRPPLERLFRSTDSSELKLHAAAMLVQLGSRVGDDYLLDTIKRCVVPGELHAASSLVKAGIKETVPILIERLGKFDTEFYSKAENQPYIDSLVSALERLGGKLPSHLKDRFSR